MRKGITLAIAACLACLVPAAAAAAPHTRLSFKSPRIEIPAGGDADQWTVVRIPARGPLDIAGTEMARRRARRRGRRPGQALPPRGAERGGVLAALRLLHGQRVRANLVFGPTGDDDMCILPGGYYDPNPAAPPGRECDLALMPPLP